MLLSAQNQICGYAKNTVLTQAELLYKLNCLFCLQLVKKRLLHNNFFNLAFQVAKQVPVW